MRMFVRNRRHYNKLQLLGSRVSRNARRHLVDRHRVTLASRILQTEFSLHSFYDLADFNSIESQIASKVGNGSDLKNYCVHGKIDLARINKVETLHNVHNTLRDLGSIKTGLKGNETTKRNLNVCNAASKERLAEADDVTSKERRHDNK